MSIPAAKIKKLCSASEAALVRASRKGQLEELTYAQVKQFALRTRKQLDKWRDLKRGQTRSRIREHGTSTVDANTKLKYQAFREALASFEAHLARLDAAGQSGGEKPARKTKQQRNAEHRATRAAVRKGMTAVLDLANSSAVTPATEAKKQPVAKPAPTAKSSPAKTAAKPAATATPKKTSAGAGKSTAKTVTAPARVPKTATFSRGLQLQATAAAKQRRIARSGKTTRLRSHTKAQGKRTQARRDAKG